MQDPDLRTPRTYPVLSRGLVMYKQIRLQRFNQTQHLRPPQFGMDCCACELERPARTRRQNMRIPELGFMRTPNVEHALSPAHGQIPRSEEHTSELQSRLHLVCRLLLEKKKNYHHKL